MQSEGRERREANREKKKEKKRKGDGDVGYRTSRAERRATLEERERCGER